LDETNKNNNNQTTTKQQPNNNSKNKQIQKMAFRKALTRLAAPAQTFTGGGGITGDGEA
jgi:hypothetical protein